MLAIFTDLDGTLYPYLKSYELYPETFNDIIDAIKKGVVFNIATGNGIYPKIIKIAEKIHAKYLIGCTGGIIYDVENKNFINKLFLTKKEVNYLFNLFKNYHNISFIFYTENNLYTSDRNSKLYNVIKSAMVDENNDNDIFLDLNEKILDKEIIKINFCAKTNNSNIEIVKHKIKMFLNLDLISYSDGVEEIISKNVNKGTAIKFLNENYLKIDNNNIMTIGDSSNDIQMLKMYPNSFAMGNSKQIIKKIATYTTKSVHENGLGLAIKEFLTKKEY